MLRWKLPAMAMMDAVVRLLPGVLNDSLSAVQDSFADGLLDCPHYTRPEEYDGVRVPDVLLGGHHAEIEKWLLADGVEQALVAGLCGTMRDEAVVERMAVGRVKNGGGGRANETIQQNRDAADTGRQYGTRDRGQLLATDGGQQ